MQEDGYQNERPSIPVELPPGVFPPMPGYTHADLMAVAEESVIPMLEAAAVDPGLIRESLIALSTEFYAALENGAMEYAISTCHQQPCDDSLHASNIKNLADKSGSLAVDAAADLFLGSPLMSLGQEFYSKFIRQAGNAVFDHVQKLQKN